MDGNADLKTDTGLSRRDLLRTGGLLGAAFGLAGSLAACGGPASTEPGDSGGSNNGADTGGVIDAGISYTLSGTFDPGNASSAVVTAANLHVFEGLIDLDPVTRDPYPALAIAMPERIDELTWRVTLRDGATWHDGEPVTADDVVFSFKRVIDEDLLMNLFIPFIDRVEAIDERTIEFGTAYPFALFGERISVIKIVPRHILEGDAEAFSSSAVGSGPFRLVTVSPNDRLVFERADTYNGPRPARAAEMTWHILPDAGARVTALESDRVQAIEDVPYLDVDRLTENKQVESVLSFGLLFMMINCSRPPFDDHRVRQALFYALDYGTIIGNGLLGNGERATSFVQRGHPAYVEAGTVYAHEPDRAKELLEEAGVADLSIDLYTTDTAWVTDIGPLVKASFDAIGIATILHEQPSATLYPDTVASGSYDVVVAPGDPSVFGNDADLLLRWWYGPEWPTNRFFWADTPEYGELVDLLDAAAREPDENARLELWGAAYDLISEQVPLYPIVHRMLPTAWEPAALDGFEPLPTTGLSFLDVAPRKGAS